MLHSFLYYNKVLKGKSIYVGGMRYPIKLLHEVWAFTRKYPAEVAGYGDFLFEEFFKTHAVFHFSILPVVGN
jgi:hypothetical protein